MMQMMKSQRIRTETRKKRKNEVKENGSKVQFFTLG